MRRRRSRMLPIHTHISIHASAWDATKPVRTMVSDLIISIHASAWDATHVCSKIELMVPFQSTHPRGMRPAGEQDGEISGMDFNPRIRVGCDVISILVRASASKFQSTHPRGMRHSPMDSKKIAALIFQSTHPRGMRLMLWRIVSVICRYFNPRIRVGCDGLVYRFYKPTELFQSTHPRGMRLNHRRGFVRVQYISIHASAWDATVRASASKNTALSDFNPRIRVGCDPRRRRSKLPTRYFNPRIRVGCDWDSKPIRGWLEIFQSTHPRGMRP